MRPACIRSTLLATLVMVSSLVWTAGAAAQAPDNPGTGPDPARRSPEPDFFFKQPVGAVAVRSTFVFPRAASDIYAFVENQLTLEKGDFRAPGITADLAFTISSRLDALAGFEFARSKAKSEYRHYVDNNSLPIEQRTALSTFAVNASLRYALVPRGRAVSRLAWVPRRVVPYVGAGGGATRYELKQTGDFVDFVDLSVFPDTFRSAGWTPSAHVLAGVDLLAYRHMYVSAEGRYVWGKAELGQDFTNFHPIDLAGFRTTLGVSFPF